MLKNAIGKPVRGDSFFDREAEQRQLWRILDADDILLLAPRRVGKHHLCIASRKMLVDMDSRPHSFL